MYLQSRAIHPTNLQHISPQSAAVFPSLEVMSVLIKPCVGLAALKVETLLAVPMNEPLLVLHVRVMTSPPDVVVVGVGANVVVTVVVGVLFVPSLVGTFVVLDTMVGRLVLGAVGITVLATVVVASVVVVGVVAGVVGVVAAVVVVVAGVLSPSHPLRY